MTEASSLPLSNTDETKTIISKRPHKKSRLGCTNCKQRKVKCDEARPVCRSCRLRRTKCEYGQVISRRNLSIEAPIIPTSYDSPCSDTTATISIVNEPLFVPQSIDIVDAKLLCFYTSTTYKSLTYIDDKQKSMNDTLQTVLVQHAFEASFLMNSVLELATLHMQSLGQATDSTRALVYRGRSFEGYRKAIEDAYPNTFSALLANSVLRPMLSAQFFRDPAFKDLYLLDWMFLWRGVETIINITSKSAIEKSGMQTVFAVPPLDSNIDVTATPKELLLMISFLDHDDEDAIEMQTYQESLRALASLFQNLRNGMDSTMALRIMIWSAYAPRRLLELARARRPRALVIIAYYASFLKLLQDIWWLVGVGDRSLRDICHFLEPRWHKFLSIPLAALLINNTADLSRVILGSGDQ